MFLSYLILFLISLLSLNIIIVKNSIHAILSLIVIYLLTAILLIYLGLPFIGLLLIIIYVGAISILFLFIIMMLNSRILEAHNIWINPSTILWIIFSIIILIFISIYILNINIYYSNLIIHSEWIVNIYSKTDVELLGEILLNHYNIYLIIIGFILLIAMIASISITYETGRTIKSNNLNNNIIYTKIDNNIIYGDILWF